MNAHGWCSFRYLICVLCIVVYTYRIYIYIFFFIYKEGQAEAGCLRLASWQAGSATEVRELSDLSTGRQVLGCKGMKPEQPMVHLPVRPSSRHGVKSSLSPDSSAMPDP